MRARGSEEFDIEMEVDYKWIKDVFSETKDVGKNRQIFRLWIKTNSLWTFTKPIAKLSMIFKNKNSILKN